MSAPVPGGVKSRVLTALVLALVVVVVLLALPPLATLALLTLAWHTCWACRFSLPRFTLSFGPIGATRSPTSWPLKSAVTG